MQKAFTPILIGLTALISLAPATAQAQTKQDFQKVSISTSEYTGVTRSGVTTHCVFVNFNNMDNRSRTLNSDEKNALSYQLHMIDIQQQEHITQLIEQEGNEGPDSFCSDRKIKNRPDIKQCLGVATMRSYGKRNCYLIRIDTEMGVRPSYLKLTPYNGNPINIRL
jgi:hypothetical protein